MTEAAVAMGVVAALREAVADRTPVVRMAEAGSGGMAEVVAADRAVAAVPAEALTMAVAEAL